VDELGSHLVYGTIATDGDNNLATGLHGLCSELSSMPAFFGKPNIILEASDVEVFPKVLMQAILQSGARFGVHDKNRARALRVHIRFLSESAKI
jgi:hypothetical protein